MAQTLDEYVAQATQAYAPSSSAIQSQLDALAGQLDTTNQQINRNYALQQAQLDKSRNQAASAASMQAAGSGGSFGGAANIANRKYYNQSYIPAQITLQTNQANDLASARQASEDTRTNLNAQLANLQAQANQQALAQYYSDLEAERERENQRALAAQQNAAQNAYYQYLMEAAQQGNTSSTSSGLKNWDYGNGYSIQEMPDGTASYRLNGNVITAGQFLTGTGANTNWDLWNDIWNNGVSTTGVGSDTVEYFKRNAALNNTLYNNQNNLKNSSLKNSSAYGYLWK